MVRKKKLISYNRITMTVFSYTCDRQCLTYDFFFTLRLSVHMKGGFLFSVILTFSSNDGEIQVNIHTSCHLKHLFQCIVEHQSSGRWLSGST